MKRLLAALLGIFLLAGCGPYKITYQMPSRTPSQEPPFKQGHLHGIGPMIIGGGGLFFLFSQISPALFDYSGVRQVKVYCPHGIAELTHLHTFGQNSGAALASWLLIVNFRHGSDELWTCALPEEQEGGEEGEAEAPSEPVPQPASP